MITPNERYTELAKALGYDNLYFKREDLHPLGSHKGRSIPVMIDHYCARGSQNFAISSSGNAALAALLYIKNKPDVKLEIFVGNNIAPHKLEKLAKIVDEIGQPERIKVTKVERPLQSLTQAVQNGAISLRQSTDDLALVGYESLAKEILSVSNVAAVFIGTSSGTTAQALAGYFIKEKVPVQVHIVQTSSCHPIAGTCKECENGEISIADAIVDKTALRKAALLSLIKKTGGSGWCATNEDILMAQKLTKTHTGLDISTNSTLSIVGAIKAQKSGSNIKGPIVCVICGE